MSGKAKRRARSEAHVGPFEVKYELGHSYQETWTRTEQYCPECGKSEVWCENSEGDYYVGPTYMCAVCGASGNMWNGQRNGNWQDRQRFEAIAGELRRLAGGSK